MITVRQATPEERTLIINSMPVLIEGIPERFHLTDQEVAELCGINYLAEKEAAEREHREWLEFSWEAMRRIMIRDGD